MMIHVAKCSTNAFLRASSIRVRLPYPFQDTATIVLTSPNESTATSAHGLTEAVKTATKSVAQNSSESASTTNRPEKLGPKRMTIVCRPSFSSSILVMSSSVQTHRAVATTSGNEAK